MGAKCSYDCQNARKAFHIPDERGAFVSLTRDRSPSSIRTECEGEIHLRSHLAILRRLETRLNGLRRSAQAELGGTLGRTIVVGARMTLWSQIHIGAWTVRQIACFTGMDPISGTSSHNTVSKHFPFALTSKAAGKHDEKRGTAKSSRLRRSLIVLDFDRFEAF